METCNVNFKGRMYGRFFYSVNGESRTRLSKPAWMCQLGDNRFIKSINHLVESKKNHHLGAKLEIVEGDKTLTFEMPKEEFFGANSWFANFRNLFNAAKGPKKMLQDPHINNIVYQLPKKDLEKLIKSGPRYEYSERPDTIDLATGIVKNLLKKRIQRFRKNVETFFSKPEEKAWIDEYFSNLFKK